MSNNINRNEPLRNRTVNKKRKHNNNTNVIFQTKDVVILKPDSKKGVLVGHHFDGRFNVTKNGLRSGKSLKERNPSWAERTGLGLHDKIFFRAPFYEDNTRFVEEFSSYGKCAFIRIDPERTFVYPSEVRASEEYGIDPQVINKFRKPFKDYMKAIKNNERYPSGKYAVFYDMRTFEKLLFNPNIVNDSRFPYEYYDFPYTTEPIERNCEIVVHTDHISPEMLYIPPNVTRST
tara:strand:+ start:139 stop:837 length:699 start_codon:yes stop_codon:yes gene_type:complete